MLNLISIYLATIMTPILVGISSIYGMITFPPIKIASWEGIFTMMALFVSASIVVSRVRTLMFGMISYLKVLNIVIKNIAINMMNVFLPRQLSPKVIFHDLPVKKFSLLAYFNTKISLLIRPSFAWHTIYSVQSAVETFSVIMNAAISFCQDLFGAVINRTRIHTVMLPSIHY